MHNASSEFCTTNMIVLEGVKISVSKNLWILLDLNQICNKTCRILLKKHCRFMFHIYSITDFIQNIQIHEFFALQIDIYRIVFFMGSAHTRPLE